MNNSENRNQRVLVAEDVRVISYKVRRAMENHGFQVEVAEDGEQCLEKVESFKPDLIILDLMMPKVHGIDVLRNIKANPETRHIGVIVCTSKGYTTEQRTAEELGAFDFTTKPIEMETLLAKVEGFFSLSDGEEAPSSDQVVTATVEEFHPTLNTHQSSFRLWGTRGSIPIPGSQYTRYGGNTSCMQISCGEDIFIFDAGSGIRELGMELMKEGPRKLHLLITHTHWDHIQGFPFFIPAYVPGFDITLYGAKGFSKDLESIFHGQLDMAYFPVQMTDMNATFEFINFSETPIRIGEHEIHWEYAQHPGATVAYKINVEGTMICWMPDNEFLQGYVGSPFGISRDSDLVTPYLPMLEFLSDVDVLISEAQYTNEEYPSKVGWGHTSVSNACVLMKLANIKKWIVTHHEPMHTDELLEEKLTLTRQLMHEIGHSIDVSLGYERMVQYLRDL